MGVDDGIQEKITRLIDSSISSGLFPGAVWLVEEGDRIVSRGRAGLAQRVPSERPMRRKSIFDVASLTKPVCTATIALKMWEVGEVSLDAPVRRYLPEFSGGWKDGVILSQVLSHSSGLPSGLPIPRLCKDPPQVLDCLCKAEMAYAPGSKTLYSDVGFILLGKLLERVSGQPLDVLGRRMVFGPLGMERTVFRPPRRLRPDIVATEKSRTGRTALVGVVHDGGSRFMGGVSGHAGLFSCIDDLAKFCRMMLGKGQRLLSRQTVAEATRVWANDGENAYGLGWFKRRSPEDPASRHFSKMAYGHTGYTGTSLWIDPARDFFAILLTNRVHSQSDAGRIPEMNRTRRRFHDLALGH
jgi:CubicO group peptidase (beta-lactamase class C family)